MDAFAVTAAGLHLGRRIGEVTGRRMEIAGGAILVGIGVRILVGHLSG
jgi:putative Mn2+ efflux pump MntP